MNPAGTPHLFGRRVLARWNQLEAPDFVTNDNSGRLLGRAMCQLGRYVRRARLLLAAVRSDRAMN